MEPLELEKGCGWGAGYLHEVGGGLASWRGALRSEFLRADSDFPKGAVLLARDVAKEGALK